jgi:hypothetical protein
MSACPETTTRGWRRHNYEEKTKDLDDVASTRSAKRNARANAKPSSTTAKKTAAENAARSFSFAPTIATCARRREFEARCERSSWGRYTAAAESFAATVRASRRGATHPTNLLSLLTHPAEANGG